MKKNDIKISPIIAPPYGALSLEAMKICGISGFESACISWGGIWSSNRNIIWTKSLWTDSGLLINGIGILPRFRLKKNLKSQILLSSYLNQPIIPVGHHWDMKDGIDVLIEIASFINNLSYDIQWCEVHQMSRSNYWWKIESKMLMIKPMSKVVEVTLPFELEFDNIIVEISDIANNSDSIRVLSYDKEGSQLNILNLNNKKYTIEAKKRII